MKRISIICFLASIFLLAKSQNDLQLEWAKPLGGHLGGRNLISIDRQGTKFVMAGLIGVVDSIFGSDSLDGRWIFVTDLNGTRLLSRCYALGPFRGTHFGKDNTIWAESDSGPPDSSAIGNLKVAITKLDSTGHPFWTKLYGSTAENQQTDFITTSDGGGLILSSTNYAGGDIPFKYGNDPFTFDAWLCKLDSGGNIQWLKVLGGTGDEQPSKVKEGPPGIYSVLISTKSVDSMLLGLNFNDSAYCSWLLKVDSGGRIISSNVVPNTGNEYSENLNDFIYTPDGGVLLGGYEQPLHGDYCFPGLGYLDFTLLKVNSNYQPEWCKLNGGTFDDFLWYIIPVNDSIVVTGGYSQSRDGDMVHCDSFYTGKYHTYFSLVNINTRQTLWQKALCGSGYDEIGGMYYDSVEQALYVLINGGSSDGDFAGIAYNDSGNVYLFKYALITTGIKELDATATLKIYPNPANDFCTLQLDAVDGKYTANITDITGRQVMEFNITGSNTQIPIGNLPAGLYFVKVSDEKGRVGVGKLVKE